MSDKNIFGGGNRYGLYTPMSDVEQEVLDRLVESGDLMLEVVGWGRIEHLPDIRFGDLRIQIPFKMVFTKPDYPVPVHHFDLRLKTRSGLVLHEERMPALYDGKPIEVFAGLELHMVWDIAIQHMDPKVVKAIKPAAYGLTSANLDRDTKSPTLFGNRKLGDKEKEMLYRLREQEALARLAKQDPTRGDK